MPRNYSEHNLNRAVEDIRNGNLSTKRASRLYGIPRSTLISRTKGWKNRPCASQSKPGRRLDLPLIIESELAANIKTLSRWGFGMSRKEILNLVGTYVTENHIETRFKNNIPGKDWFTAFCKRHNLSCKKPIKRQSIRTEQTKPEVIYGFFDLYEKTVDDLGLRDKPSQIFNLDETSLCHDPSNTKVVAEKNKAVFRHTQGTGRTNTSILFVVSANGDKLPPFILYKAKHLWDIWMPENAFPNTGYAATASGWMTADSFYSWFKNSFLNNCPNERPLLLIFDGHVSHISDKLIRLALQENVSLLKLPAHTTHILQPLDALPFGILKKTWDEKLTIWQRENYGTSLSKAKFAVTIGEIWANFPTALIKRAFQITGLYDDRTNHKINRAAIKEDIFNAQELAAYKGSKQIQPNPENEEEKNLEKDHIPAVEISPTTLDDVDLPSTSGLNVPTAVEKDSEPPKHERTSFETLLLQKISCSKKTPNKRKKIGNSNFGDVLTREDYLENLNKTKQKCDKKAKKNVKRQDDSSSSSSDISIHSEGDEYQEVETLQDLVELESTSAMIDEPEDIFHMTPGAWVLATYATKKVVKRYVGQILKINQDDSLEIKFARRKKDYFIWPEVEDIDTKTADQIYQVLPTPTTGRRGEIRFPIQFSGLNVQ